MESIDIRIGLKKQENSIYMYILSTSLPMAMAYDALITEWTLKDFVGRFIFRHGNMTIDNITYTK